jgi:hypothetical protein
MASSGGIERIPEPIAPRVRVGDAGGLGQPFRGRSVAFPSASHGSPGVQPRGQGHSDRRRPSLDLDPRLARRHRRNVDPGLADGIGIRRVRGQLFVAHVNGFAKELLIVLSRLGLRRHRLHQRRNSPTGRLVACVGQPPLD